jgi:hypothetical protein
LAPRAVGGAEGYLSSTLIAFTPRRSLTVAGNWPAAPNFAEGDRMESWSGATCDPAVETACAGDVGRYVFYNGYDNGFAGDDDYAYDSLGYPNDSFGFSIFSGDQRVTIVLIRKSESGAFAPLFFFV